tara:strand:- start:2151 stop:2285 length:135 start_codon:yes stop_codon:yes gene_type:complete
MLWGDPFFTEREGFASVQVRFGNGCIANIIASCVTQNKIRTMAI